MNNKVW